MNRRLKRGRQNISRQVTSKGGQATGWRWLREEIQAGNEGEAKQLHTCTAVGTKFRDEFE